MEEVEEREEKGKKVHEDCRWTYVNFYFFWCWHVLTLSPDLSLKVFPQTRHLYGRALLWLRMWSRIFCLHLNALLQWGHLNTRPLWLLIWTRSVRSLFSHLPHSWHCFCSLFATCEYKCPFSTPWVGNVLAHIWHINSHTLSCTFRWWAVAPPWVANLQTKIYQDKIKNVFPNLF